MFENLTTDGLEKTEDRLGGGGILDTDVYKGKLIAVYLGKSQSSKARSATYLMKMENGYQYSETTYFTNRNDENFYKNGDAKVALPGFQTLNSACLLYSGQPLTAQTTEKRTFDIYDFEQKKDIATEVDCIAGLFDKDILVAIERQTVDKQKKGDNGYYNTGETRDQNEIVKFFHPDSRRTSTECLDQLESAVFIDKWLEKNQGKTRNKAKGKAGKSGAPGASADSSEETESLFS